MLRADEHRALLRVLAYLRRHRLRIAGGLAATAAASLLTAAQPLLMRAVVDQAIPARRWDLLAALTLALALVPFARLGLGTLQALWLNGTAQQVARQLRVELLDHLLRLPLSFHAASKTGELTSRLTSDCGRLAGFVSTSLLPTAAHALQVVVLVAVLLSLNAPLALAVFLVFPVFHLLGRVIGRRAAAIEGEWQAARGEGAALLQEVLAGVRTVKAFTREAAESARWGAWNAHDLRLWLRQTNWAQVLAASNQAMLAVGTALVLGFGGWQVATGRMSLGTLLAFLAFAPQLYSTCGALVTSQVEIGKLEAYMARVFDLLDLPDERALWPTGRAARLEDPGRVPVHAGGCEVAFEGVSFAYEDGRGGLTDVSLRIAPGEFVAFVGPSGGGKSTLLDLLMGFYQPAAGSIRLDQCLLWEWPLERLRREVAIVSQDVHVWNASIRANLLYAHEGATEEALREAVRAAQLEGFIGSLPQGYATVLGERGVRLSGGERQRLSIARALLRNPRLLLLDEATAALDALTERALQQGLRPFLRDRTVVAVAHRLATILDCDRILVVAGGRVVQEGPHRQLVAAPGLYHDLYRAQFRTEPGGVTAG